MRALSGIGIMVATRVLTALATILAVSALVFFSMQLIEGSYEELFFPLSTPEERALIAQQYGLDKPIIQQYFIWLGNAVQGDFGTSLVSRKPVMDELVQRLPVTLELGLLALLFIVVFGLPLGVISGLFFRSRVSQFGRTWSMVLMSVPDFVLGSLFLWLASTYGLWFKAGGWSPLSEGLVSNLQYALLPAFVLSATGTGLILSTTRSGVLQILGQDFIFSAISRGVTPGTTLRRHVLRNTLIPVLTIFAIVAGYILGGAVLVETVFSLDGVGRLLVNAIASRDYPVVQAGVLLSATIFVSLNTVADMLYAVIDPRVGQA